MSRRVVVTGMGIVSPLGVGVDTVWKKLLAGDSGISSITKFDASEVNSKIAGQVPREGEGAFDPDKYVTPKEQRKMDEFIIYAIAAAEEAVKDAQWEPTDEASKERTGVMIGSGIGGLDGITKNAITMQEKGSRRISPFFIPSCLINLASGHVSIRHGFKGPNHSVVTACATGAHAIGDAARMIRDDDADVMVAGGAESSVCMLGVGGFASMKALSTQYNEAPKKGSRPWDEGRDGFVIAEGAGVLILEEYEHAKKRGAKIYAEIVGYGLSGDAYHITAPADDGDGAYRAMKAALKKAGIKAEDLDYINAHGTSTPKGDEIELRAMRRLLGDKVGDVSVSSTKSSVGHLLGAAGGVEAIFCIKAVNDQVVPATLNLDTPCEIAEGFDLVPHKAKTRKVEYAMSNSFGFGGTNASLIIKRLEL